MVEPEAVSPPKSTLLLPSPAVFRTFDNVWNIGYQNWEAISAKDTDKHPTKQPGEPPTPKTYPCQISTVLRLRNTAFYWLYVWRIIWVRETHIWIWNSCIQVKRSMKRLFLSSNSVVSWILVWVKPGWMVLKNNIQLVEKPDLPDFFFCPPLCAACGSLWPPNQVYGLALIQWECRVLGTGPPKEFHLIFYNPYFCEKSTDLSLLN